MTNKFLISALFVSIFTIVNLNAQKIGLRVEYGVQNLAQESNFLVSANKTIDYEIATVSVSPSRSIGLYTKFDYGWMFFQPEFLYTSYSQTLAVESFRDEGAPTGMNEYSETFQQFDIPLYAGIQFKRIKLGVGPVFHIGQHIDSEIAQFNNLEIRPTRLSAGLQTGIGIDLDYFNIDFKYQREFNQATDHIYFNNYNRNLDAAVSSFRVGLSFALGRK